MECSEVRESLSSYIDEVLPELEREKVDRHLAECTLCRQELADLRKTVEVIKALGEVVPPENFRLELLERLKHNQAPDDTSEQAEIQADAWSRPLWNINKIKSRWVAFAAMLFIGLGIGALTDRYFTPLGMHSYADKSEETVQNGIATNETMEKNSLEDSGATGSNGLENYKVTDGSIEPVGPAAGAKLNESVTVEQDETRSFGTAREGKANYDSSQVNQEALQEESNQGEEAFSGGPEEQPPTLDENISAPDLRARLATAPDLADNAVSSPEVRTFGAPQKDAALNAPTGNALTNSAAISDEDTPIASNAQPEVGDRVAMGEGAGASAAMQPKLKSADKAVLTEKEGKVTAESAAKGGQTAKDSTGKAADSDQSGLMENSQQAGAGGANETAENRQIIKNGWLTVEVTEYKETAKNVNSLAAKYGGYVETSEEYTNEIMSGTYTIRVPVKRFADALQDFEKMGKVVSKRLAGEDVSIEYRDANARLRNLKRQETRLLALVDKAETLADVLALENELTRVRQEVESIEARINYLSNVAEMATIHLEIRDVKDKNTPGAEGVFKRAWVAFKESCGQLIGFMEKVVISLGRALPFVVLVAAAVIGYRFYKNKK